MIAVKALYRNGEIEFLGSPPALKQSPVIIIFLEAERVEDPLASYAEQIEAMDWGDPMDEEGGRILVAMYEELAPYRTEVNQTYDSEIEG